ncbi:hypothetical protein M758_UG050700, partial [Ceratodon purpureus]
LEPYSPHPHLCPYPTLPRDQSNPLIPRSPRLTWGHPTQLRLSRHQVKGPLHRPRLLCLSLRSPPRPLFFYWLRLSRLLVSDSPLPLQPCASTSPEQEKNEQDKIYVYLFCPC